MIPVCGREELDLFRKEGESILGNCENSEPYNYTDYARSIKKSTSIKC